MLIKIKNMVCERCENIVNTIVQNLGLEAEYIAQGQVMLKGRVLQYQLRLLDKFLKETGLEVIVDKKSLLIQKVKNIIYEMVYTDQAPATEKFSDYLSRRLNYSYTYLAGLFSQECHTTIEKFIIEQKIEKVKYMLVEDKDVISHIACKMNYSSVSHLSAQFKKVTGVTPSDYKARFANGPVQLTA